MDSFISILYNSSYSSWYDIIVYWIPYYMKFNWFPFIGVNHEKFSSEYLLTCYASSCSFFIFLLKRNLRSFSNVICQNISNFRRQRNNLNVLNQVYWLIHLFYTAYSSFAGYLKSECKKRFCDNNVLVIQVLYN